MLEKKAPHLVYEYPYKIVLIYNPISKIELYSNSIPAKYKTFIVHKQSQKRYNANMYIKGTNK